MKKLSALVLMALGWAPVHVLAGPVIYSNIGPGYAGDTTEGWGSGGDYFGTTFVTSAGGTLAQMIIGAGSDTITMDTAGLYTNSGGGPGTLLESWNVALPYSTGSTEMLTSALNPVLTASTQYWFVFGPGAATVQWTGNDTGVEGDPWSGTTLTGLSGGFMESGDFALGIELIGQTSTPEPGTGALMATACVALAALRRVQGRISQKIIRPGSGCWRIS